MTKIDANMKVSKVEAGSATPEFKSQGAATSASATGDSYSQAAANPYAGLVSGNPKAVEVDTGLDQLVEAYVAEQVPSTRHRSPMQEFIKSNFTMGVANAAPPPAFEDVHVPEFQREIASKNPGITKKTATMEPVVERYKELQAMIEKLIEQNKASRAVQNSKGMTPSEVRALIKQGKVLEDKLGRCSDELKEAQFYLRWADKNEKAAKAAAEAKDAAENAR